jgi:hypothetical protein
VRCCSVIFNVFLAGVSRRGDVPRIAWSVCMHSMYSAPSFPALGSIILLFIINSWGSQCTSFSCIHNGFNTACGHCSADM